MVRNAIDQVPIQSETGLPFTGAQAEKFFRGMDSPCQTFQIWQLTLFELKKIAGLFSFTEITCPPGESGGQHHCGRVIRTGVNRERLSPSEGFSPTSFESGGLRAAG